MKKLEFLTLSYLTNLEFGQHTTRVHAEITAAGESAPTITDTSLLAYLSDLNLKNLAYEKAMMQIIKSNETLKLLQADDLRDKAFTTAQRYLSVFEYSTEPDMLDCYHDLNNLFQPYKGMQKWNYEQQTTGMNNLIDDLQSARYYNSVDMLGLLEFVLRMKTTNDNFNALFSTRTHEQASKEVFDVKQLKSDLKTSYQQMIEYVLAMAKAKDTPEFNATLSIINTIRKYYADLIARRKPEPKPVTPSEN